MNRKYRYRGFIGVTKADAEAGVLHGNVVGIRDVITFEAKSQRDVAQAFRDSVDDYLDFCRQQNRTPDQL